MNLLQEGFLNFIIQKKNNRNDLIYKYKTEGMSPKDFTNDQNLIDVFKN